MARKLAVLTEDDLGSDPELDEIVWAVIADHVERSGKPMPLEDLFVLMKDIEREGGGKIARPSVKWSVYRLYFEGMVALGAPVSGEGWTNNQKSFAMRGRTGPGQEVLLTEVTIADPTFRPGSHSMEENYAKGPVPNKPGAIPPKRWPQSAEQLIAMGAPLTVAYGAGVDSTAMLVEFVRLGIRPELILFADVGAEKPETYEYLPIMQAYLKEHGFPRIVTVNYRMTPEKVAERKRKPFGKGGKPLDPREYKTITNNMIYNRTLPSLAYGFQDHSCSSKWKVGPQLDYIANGAFSKRARKAWDAGLPVIRAIGFDASKGDQGRRDRIPDDVRYMHWYPLQEWGWDRERCKEEIRKAGLPVPLKSACFFCPSTHPWEIQRFVLLDDPFVGKLRQIEDMSRPYNQQGPNQGLWWTGDKLPKPVRAHHPYKSEYWFESGKLTPKEMDYFIKVKWGGLPEYNGKVKSMRGNIGRPGTKPGRISDFVEVFKRFCKQQPGSPQCRLEAIDGAVGDENRVKDNPAVAPIGPDPYSYSSEGKPVTYHENPAWDPIGPDPYSQQSAGTVARYDQPNPRPVPIRHGRLEGIASDIRNWYMNTVAQSDQSELESKLVHLDKQIRSEKKKSKGKTSLSAKLEVQRGIKLLEQARSEVQRRLVQSSGAQQRFHEALFGPYKFPGIGGDVPIDIQVTSDSEGRMGIGAAVAIDRSTPKRKGQLPDNYWMLVELHGRWQDNPDALLSELRRVLEHEATHVARLRWFDTSKYSSSPEDKGPDTNWKQQFAYANDPEEVEAKAQEIAREAVRRWEDYDRRRASDPGLPMPTLDNYVSGSRTWLRSEWMWSEASKRRIIQKVARALEDAGAELAPSTYKPNPSRRPRSWIRRGCSR